MDVSAVADGVEIVSRIMAAATDKSKIDVIQIVTK